MPYAEGRLIHDADSHSMEPPGWLDDYLEPGIREKAEDLLRVGGRAREFVETLMAKHDDPEFRRAEEDEIMLRKGYQALGSFDNADRPRALDVLGFKSQLVFTTSGLGPLIRSDRDEDKDFAYGVARAHNRYMVDFCAIDRRLLPVCYLPISELEQVSEFTAETIELGAAALMVSSMCPKTHSPSHVALDPVWAQAEEAGIPVVFHVGGGEPMNNTYKENGLPPVKDFAGGDGNFTSVSFMYIPTAPMQTLATMIIDGVLERFPMLKVGVIEQGASWVPGWMRMLDSAADAFQKNEERLHKLNLRPSEYVQRQIRVTPYPHEPAGWIIKQTGPDVCLFSSDYPHTEGGRHPLKRFDATLEGCSDAEKQAFYSSNFEDLMGQALDREREPVPA